MQRHANLQYEIQLQQKRAIERQKELQHQMEVERLQAIERMREREHQNEIKSELDLIKAAKAMESVSQPSFGNIGEFITRHISNTISEAPTPVITSEDEFASPSGVETPGATSETDTSLDLQPTPESEGPSEMDTPDDTEIDTDDGVETATENEIDTESEESRLQAVNDGVHEGAMTSDERQTEVGDKAKKSLSTSEDDKLNEEIVGSADANEIKVTEERIDNSNDKSALSENDTKTEESANSEHIDSSVVSGHEKAEEIKQRFQILKRIK
jgi:hypothetical protein